MKRNRKAVWAKPDDGWSMQHFRKKSFTVDGGCKPKTVSYVTKKV